jgi:predicted RNA-binding Zn-ribbon protein involved in translation (DUF1610 family)
MPIIGPPSDSVFIPTDYTTPVENAERKARDAQIIEYLNCTHWKCPECGSTIFGRSKMCGYCRSKYGKQVLKPE